MIGGAPGAGKTQVAYLLARELGGAIVEVDDIYLR
jgi:predicted kinase